jgi:hypothetical protein
VASTYQATQVAPQPNNFSFAFGSPLLVAATIGGSLLYNAHQRNLAERAAAIQWRTINEGAVFLTNRRICLQGRVTWVDLDYEAVRSLEALPDGVVLHQSGRPPLKLVTSWLEYFYVMLSSLALGRKVKVELDPDFVARARATGALREDPSGRVAGEERNSES